MTYTANNHLKYIAFTVVTLFAISWAKAENCQCATPPGGEVKCPKGYAAYCIVRDGKSFTGCEELPSKFTVDDLEKWIVEKALVKAHIDPHEKGMGPQIHFNATTGAGEATNTSVDYKITFQLPPAGVRN